jgi:hypothetical protein
MCDKDSVLKVKAISSSAVMGGLNDLAILAAAEK